MKKLIIFFLLGSLFLLSSCIKINSTATIGDDLSINEKTIIDYSALNAMWDSFAFWTWAVSEKKTPCEQFEESESEQEDKEDSKKEIYWYKKIECTNLDENRAMITFSDWSVVKYVTFKDWKYYFDLDKWLGWISKEIEKNKWVQKTKEEIEQLIKMYKQMWVEMDYAFVFPGEIESTPLWSFSGNTLKFSIYDIIEIMWNWEFEDAYLIFKKPDNSEVVWVGVMQNTNTYTELKKKYLRELILAKNNLKNSKYKKFVNQFEKTADKISFDKAKEIYDKINKLNLEDPKLSKYKDLLTYLRAKLGLIIIEKTQK